MYYLHVLQVLHGKNDFLCALLTLGLVPRLRDVSVVKLAVLCGLAVLRNGVQDVQNGEKPALRELKVESKKS
jgi:hypothetical protein